MLFTYNFEWIKLFFSIFVVSVETSEIETKCSIYCVTIQKVGRGGRVVSAFTLESEHPGSKPPVASLVPPTLSSNLA